MSIRRLHNASAAARLTSREKEVERLIVVNSAVTLTSVSSRFFVPKRLWIQTCGLQVVIFRSKPAAIYRRTKIEP